MAFTLENLIVLVLAFLPGATTQVYRRRYVPQTRQPSPFEEVTVALQDTLLIHFIGVVLFFLALLFWTEHGASAHAAVLLSRGVQVYFQSYPVLTLVALTLYLCYLAAASFLVGALNLPQRISGALLTGLSKTPGLGKLVPGEILYADPVWYRSFHTRAPSPNSSVFVRVRMKNNDVYLGTLRIFPTLGDDVQAKDFLLSEGEYLPQGDITRRQALNTATIPGFGGILLNSGNVLAIEFSYS